MIVERSNYPHLRAAFAAIERDNGGHLIGTVYRGTPIDLDHFSVPDAWAHLALGADRALARLEAASKDDLETFVVGEQSEAEAIELRQGDLAEARILLNDWFNGWQPEDAPFTTSAHFCPTCKKHVPSPCVARQNTVGCPHLADFGDKL